MENTSFYSWTALVLLSGRAIRSSELPKMKVRFPPALKLRGTRIRFRPDEGLGEEAGPDIHFANRSIPSSALYAHICCEKWGVTAQNTGVRATSRCLEIALSAISRLDAMLRKILRLHSTEFDFLIVSFDYLANI